MRFFRSASVIAMASALAACAAVLGLTDPTLDETAGTGGDGGGVVGADGSGDETTGEKDGAVTLPDGRAPSCIGSTAWGTPTKVLVPSNYPVKFYPSLTDDELTIVWTEVEPAANRYHLTKASRPSLDAGFVLPVPVGDQATDWQSACVTPNASNIYASQSQAGGPDAKIYRIPGEGGVPIPQTKLDMAPRVYCRTIVADASVMYGHFDAPINGDPLQQGYSTMFHARRVGAEDWQVDELYRDLDAGDAGARMPTVSRDQLEMFFVPSNANLPHIHTMRRSDASAPWGPPSEVNGISLPNAGDAPGWLSADGCRLYFARAVVPDGAFATFDLYVVARTAQ